MSYPRRIVCLTEETTETLYLLGEGDRVVGISGYTVRPPEARQKPKVSSFLHDHVAIGDLLDVSPPAGDFVVQSSDAPLLLASAGAGTHDSSPATATL